MDNLSIANRRKNMQNIRSKNTSFERSIFQLLKKKGFKFKEHYKIIGKPDIAFPKKKIAVFLDSDFWHGWNFPRWKNRLPKVYWREKIACNIERDKKKRKALQRNGWKVIRVWEHQVKDDPVNIVNRIKKAYAEKRKSFI
ncbi:MAG: DNA mismatch endonuclease Vsr [Candidatus Omnitrophica bacterium]|nr:DNA mismatch endonuclease Vsr [Candidatus Omnitrophota bacterium]